MLPVTLLIASLIVRTRDLIYEPANYEQDLYEWSPLTTSEHQHMLISHQLPRSKLRYLNKLKSKFAGVLEIMKIE